MNIQNPKEIFDFMIDQFKEMDSAWYSHTHAKKQILKLLENYYSYGIIKNNGTCTPRYEWSQTLATIDIYLPPGTPIKKIEQSRIIIDENRQIMLWATVDIEGSTWCIDDDATIISLEKYKKETWWPCIETDGYFKLDTTKFVPEEREFHEMSPEIQQKIIEMRSSR